MELCNGRPSEDFHIQCMRGTVKSADEIKVTGNVCEGRLGILERKKSAEDLSKRTRMKFSRECKIIVGLTEQWQEILIQVGSSSGRDAMSSGF